VPSRRVVLVAGVVVSVAVSGAIVAGAATVSALKTGPPATYPQFTHAGRAASRKRAHAEYVKCPFHVKGSPAAPGPHRAYRGSQLFLGGPGDPIRSFPPTPHHVSNRWAVFALTYVQRADGYHPHYSLKLKTVHGKTAKLCTDLLWWGTDVYPPTYYYTFDGLVNGEWTSPGLVRKESVVTLTTP
jgi:hypothetical protein